MTNTTTTTLTLTSGRTMRDSFDAKLLRWAGVAVVAFLVSAFASVAGGSATVTAAGAGACDAAVTASATATGKDRC